VKQEVRQIEDAILTTQMRLWFPTFCRKQQTFWSYQSHYQ